MKCTLKYLEIIRISPNKKGRQPNTNRAMIIHSIIKTFNVKTDVPM